MGCLRTLEEIADWSEYGRAEKLRVLSLLPARSRDTESRESGTAGSGGADGTMQRD